MLMSTKLSGRPSEREETLQPRHNPHRAEMPTEFFPIRERSTGEELQRATRTLPPSVGSPGQSGATGFFLGARLGTCPSPAWKQPGSSLLPLGGLSP